MDPSSNEPTGALHLSSRNLANSSASPLGDYLASLPESDRLVIEQVESSGGEKAMILINRGEGKGSRFLVENQGVTIGRSTSSSVFLDDVTVSRAHAVVEKRGSGFFLRDCGSLNGTYLNDELVTSAQLKSGDQIQIGKFHLIFVCGIKVNKSNRL
ncbi:MAG: FHA domain-containing protein [Actinomycetota bacterium]|nr:FHA domain-containing protein [Actinomycetota bacterium]